MAADFTSRISPPRLPVFTIARDPNHSQVAHSSLDSHPRLLVKAQWTLLRALPNPTFSKVCPGFEPRRSSRRALSTFGPVWDLRF